MSEKDNLYNHEACEIKHKHINEAIEKLERKIAFFNITGIGILASLITGVLLNHFGGK